MFKGFKTNDAKTFKPKRTHRVGTKPLSVKDLLNSRAARFPEGLVLGADHAPDTDSQTETSA